eukprot:gb/GEZN01002788.1/.p1 GENE.gb/GEZN01002788.1/~~gb/GEZN01002788.1/.p1  ORF type:complete len:753 (+),score=85.47 gb/GEZN01002788.1/:273-2261(+)
MSVAFRYGHSEVADSIPLFSKTQIVPSSLPVRDCFFNPGCWTQYGIDPIINGLASTLQQEVDIVYVDAIRNFLFGGPHTGGTDLFARNVQRARDHGIPDYNAMRRHYGLSVISNWQQLTSDEQIVSALDILYPFGVDTLDAYVGGLIETAYEQGIVGELFHHAINDQYRRLRDGDRFYFENTVASGLSAEEVLEVKNTKLADILLRNTEIFSLQCSVMYQTSLNECYASRRKQALGKDAAFLVRFVNVNVVLQLVTFSVEYTPPDSKPRWLALAFANTYGRMTYSYAYICYLETGTDEPKVVAHTIGSEQAMACPSGVCRDPLQHVTHVRGQYTDGVLSFTFSRPLAPVSGNVIRPGNLFANMASGMVGSSGDLLYHGALKTSFTMAIDELNEYDTPCTVKEHAQADFSLCQQEVRWLTYSWRLETSCLRLLGETLPPPGQVPCRKYQGFVSLLTILTSLDVALAFLFWWSSWQFRKYRFFRDVPARWHQFVCVGSAGVSSSALFWFLPLSQTVCLLRVRYLACFATLLMACISFQIQCRTAKSWVKRLSSTEERGLTLATTGAVGLQVAIAIVSGLTWSGPSVSVQQVKRFDSSLGMWSSSMISVCSAQPLYFSLSLGLVYLLALAATFNIVRTLWREKQRHDVGGHHSGSGTRIITRSCL